jgi:hypothetical protein
VVLPKRDLASGYLVLEILHKQAALDGKTVSPNSSNGSSSSSAEAVAALNGDDDNDERNAGVASPRGIGGGGGGGLDPKALPPLKRFANVGGT